LSFFLRKKKKSFSFFYFNFWGHALVFFFFYTFVHCPRFYVHTSEDFLMFVFKFVFCFVLFPLFSLYVTCFSSYVQIVSIFSVWNLIFSLWCEIWNVVWFVGLCSVVSVNRSNPQFPSPLSPWNGGRKFFQHVWF